ncbi:MAG TPA: ATP-binding cassette domain-containing protein [Chthoniobacteraceae bacterium]|nr:ATP-binding cassette domain-containing protein [Chthoniobacteraceae bacterium]
MESTDIILEARGASCSRAANAGPLAAVRDVSLSLRTGSFTLLAGDGQGDAGLLLRLLGLLEVPDAGDVFFHGIGTMTLTEEDRAELRNQRYGFVFAEPFLLPSFTVVENVAMPLFKISNVDAEEARKRTETMLAFTGMESFGNSPVIALSHAQQQRVSLARALVNRPEILVVENMDAGLAGEELLSFFELVRRANGTFGTTTLFTAKEPAALKFTGRVVELSGGAIVRDRRSAVETGGAPA